MKHYPILSELFRSHICSEKNNDPRCLFVRDESLRFARYGEIERTVEDLRQHDILIVLLDTSQLGRIKRLGAFIYRNLAVKSINRYLEAVDLTPLGSFAIYPDLNEIQFVFQRHTNASRYAETQLLKSAEGLMGQVLFRPLAFLFGCSPSIDVVAVVGMKN